jgi:hypothetical protein
MVLSDDLDRRPIESLANSVGLHLHEMHRKTWLGESQVVFVVVPQEIRVREARVKPARSSTIDH